MSSRRAILDRLAAGHSVTLRVHGNSMTPLIHSGATLTFDPIALGDVRVGDVVMCRVGGRHFDAHLVTAIRDGRVQISNNHGRVNGWTGTVYARVRR